MLLEFLWKTRDREKGKKGRNAFWFLERQTHTFDLFTSLWQNFLISSGVPTFVSCRVMEFVGVQQSKKGKNGKKLLWVAKFPFTFHLSICSYHWHGTVAYYNCVSTPAANMILNLVSNFFHMASISLFSKLSEKGQRVSQTWFRLKNVQFFISQ